MHCNHLHVNGTDPTRTLTIRKRFEADLYTRFRKIKGLIRQSIVDNDAFGLTTNAVAAPNQFNFPTTDAKIAGFMAWLDEQVKEGIINVDFKGGRRTEAARSAWFNVYISSAYQQGILRGRQEINAAVKGVNLDNSRSAVQMAFNRPFHADRVGMIYLRTYDELAGITQAMDQQISRVLAQGIAEGGNPLSIAKMINDRVDKIGITRARLLARTEVIRAHHLANVQEYREAGAVGVEVTAELLTAGDSRVCSVCSGLQASTRRKPMALDQIESLIPVHPNCRCVARPRFEGDTN